MSFRHNTYSDLTPIQQSLTVDPRSMGHMHASMMLGVVLDVKTADDPQNRTAYQTNDRRGSRHEATVLILNDSSTAYLVLQNVVICPDLVSGLDNYYESLPKPSTKLVNGDPLNDQLINIDPAKLDGDWCVVGFLGNSLDQPFIIKWWPSPNNTFDPLTTKQGNPNTAGIGQSLNQRNRYFRRINGVEQVVTSKGDVIVSTTLANSQTNPGGSVENGRFARQKKDEGGSVLLYVKPSQSVEIDWNLQQDGIGVQRLFDESLPQENPRKKRATPPLTNDNTYINIDKNQVSVEVPVAILGKSKTRILWSCDAEMKDTVGTDYTLKTGASTTMEVGTSLSLTTGTSATVDVGSSATIKVGSSLSLTTGASFTIDASSSMSITTPSFSLSSPSVVLGSAPSEPVIKQPSLTASWLPLVTALNATIAAGGAAPLPPTNYALIAAIGTALTAMVSSLSGAATVSTKVG